MEPLQLTAAAAAAAALAASLLALWRTYRTRSALGALTPSAIAAQANLEREQLLAQVAATLEAGRADHDQLRREWATAQDEIAELLERTQKRVHRLREQERRARSNGDAAGQQPRTFHELPEAEQRRYVETLAYQSRGR